MQHHRYNDTLYNSIVRDQRGSDPLVLSLSATVFVFFLDTIQKCRAVAPFEDRLCVRPSSACCSIACWYRHFSGELVSLEMDGALSGCKEELRAGNGASPTLVHSLRAASRKTGSHRVVGWLSGVSPSLVEEKSAPDS